MRKMIIATLVSLALTATTVFAQRPGYTIYKLEPVNMQRVDEIAAMLADTPKGFGDPIEVRKRWDELYKNGKFTNLMVEADAIMNKPFPQMTEALYMEYFKGKDSETSKRFIMNRRRLLTKLVIAECLTNKGKYMPAILNALTSILNTTSWSFPAEDQKKTNYNGTLYTINLSSSAYGYDMAQSLYLLNSKLTTEMKEQISDALYQKIFNPTLAAIKNNNANSEFIPLPASGNHNAATLDGVIGAALATIKDKKERAVFATIAERYSNNFVEGYLEDGYCTEGVGYYSYGFGHYLIMREQLWQATKGKVDLFDRPKVKKMAEFAPNMQIINGVYPAIGDCEQYIKPDPEVMYYVNKNFGLGLKEYDDIYMNQIEQPALASVMYFFPNSASESKVAGAKNVGAGNRFYFEKAGVLTVRPAKGSTLSMGATFKGGNNNEHHNHNDIGSFSIAVGDELLMGDAGLATYTPKYFGPERYKLYKTTASFGHPVPLVANVEQRVGKEAQAVITQTNFTDNKDLFAMDISSGYVVAGLKKLIRTFTYDRTSKGYIEVKDDFAFDTDQAFETALTTRCKWKQISPTEIEISGKQQKLIVQIKAPGSFDITSEEILEGRMPYTRIGIKLKDALKAGSIVMTFKPGK